MAKKFSDDVLLSLTEAAELIGVKYQTLTKWRCLGLDSPKAVRVGARLKYWRSEVERWINSKADA